MGAMTKRNTTHEYECPECGVRVKGREVNGVVVASNAPPSGETQTAVCVRCIESGGVKSFRDEIRGTVSPHKFGGSTRAAMLWLLMLDSGQDEETGDANEWHYWVGRFGKRLLYVYPSGRVEAVLCSTEEEAKRSFENEAHAYGEVTADVD